MSAEPEEMLEGLHANGGANERCIADYEPVARCGGGGAISNGGVAAQPYELLAREFAVCA
jgi:hypothetical protein